MKFHYYIWLVFGRELVIQKGMNFYQMDESLFFSHMGGIFIRSSLPYFFFIITLRYYNYINGCNIINIIL